MQTICSKEGSRAASSRVFVEHGGLVTTPRPRINEAQVSDLYVEGQTADSNEIGDTARPCIDIDCISSEIFELVAGLDVRGCAFR